MDRTIGSKLSALRHRSGLTLDEISSRAGYRGRSSVQQYFRSDYDIDVLDPKVATRLAKALVGSGDPAIVESDLAELAGLPHLPGVEKAKGERASRRPSDQGTIPIFSATASSRRTRPIKAVASETGEECTVEAMSFEQSRPIGDAWFPAAKGFGTKPYALYLGANTLSPRHNRGEMVLVEELRPGKVGDDVIVHVDDAQSGESFFTHAVAARLAAFDVDAVKLTLLSPPMDVEISYERIIRIERIMPLSDLLTI